MTHILKTAALAAAIALIPAAAHAQDYRSDGDAPTRVRVGLGPQWTPRYPGADEMKLSPLVDVSIAKGDENFIFEAADESFDLALVEAGPFSAGLAGDIQGARRREHMQVDLPEVGTTVEVGGFAQAWLTRDWRVRGELRKGIGGHKGLIGVAAADYVARSGDSWVVAFGPRVTWTDGDYQRAYYGVTPAASATSGLPVYAIGGGIDRVGAAANASVQLTQGIGVYGYAKYDRIIGDAGDSPIVRSYGDRNELSGGVALTYTFFWRR